MEIRNLKNLVDLAETKKFILNNNLKIFIVNKGEIIFYNNCYIVHVYGYVIEDIPYIDIYRTDFDKLSVNIDSLINKMNLGTETIDFYKKIKIEYKAPVTWDGLSNIINSLKTEQNYITYLCVLNKYKPSIFNCENSFNYNLYFEKMDTESMRNFEALKEKLKTASFENIKNIL